MMPWGGGIWCLGEVGYDAWGRWDSKVEFTQINVAWRGSVPGISLTDQCGMERECVNTQINVAWRGSVLTLSK